MQHIITRPPCCPDIQNVYFSDKERIMRQPWFRMYGDMIDDPKIGQLSDENFRTWIEILCLACQSDFDDGNTGLSVEEIEWRLRRNISETFHETYIETGHVTLCNGHVTIANWNKRQMRSDLSTKRVRKHRESKKKINCNVTETLLKRNETVLETETEGETDLKLSPIVDNSLPQRQPCPHQSIINLYHEILPVCPHVVKLTDARKAHMRSRWREHPDIKIFKQFFFKVSQSQFLTGRISPSDQNRKPFKADLAWLMKPDNFTKVLEDKYS